MRVAWKGLPAWIAAGFFLAFGPAAHSFQAGTMERVQSSRSDAQIPVFFSGSADSVATLVLLPGGAGGIGKLGADNWPDGGNFLIRTAQMFAAQSFNVALVSRPTDQTDMDYPFRNSDAHIDDLRRVIRLSKSRWNAPVWLIGTSRGTVSGTAAAIAMRDEGLIAGLVLTSSVTSGKVVGAVPGQALGQLKIPVLVVHHALDACKVCRPQEAKTIDAKLVNSPMHAFWMLDGGGNPTGDPCEPMHYHGFIGMESQVVQQVGDWIKQALR